MGRQVDRRAGEGVPKPLQPGRVAQEVPEVPAVGAVQPQDPLDPPAPRRPGDDLRVDPPRSRRRAG